MVHDMLNTMEHIFKGSASFSVHSEGVYHLFLSTTSELFMVMLPLFIFLPIVGAGSQILQVGFNFSAEPLKWDLTRMSPLKGLKRIFSSKGLVEFIKSILKMGTVGFISYVLIMGEMETLITLNDAGFRQIVSFIPQLALKLIIWLTLLLLVLALLDLIFQRWKFEQDIRMSKHAVKEEFKQMEGDPLIKARMKSLQKSFSRNRMISEVSDADIVITNPQHLAVALAYDQIHMGAPKVIAKGAGFIAKRIREECDKHRIPIVEDKLLAQTLYKTVEIGQEIPSDLYRAVAEILSYVYKMGKLKRTLNG